MRIPVNRKQVFVLPDSKRVIARFFFNGQERATEVIKQISLLTDDEVYKIIIPILQEFSKRHRNITRILNRNADKLCDILKCEVEAIKQQPLYRKLLIGSYFTHEYSIESAAFFNPSIVDDPNQSDLEQGQRRVIISFRAVGEGHISSIVFRSALIDRRNNIDVLPAGRYVDEAEVIKNFIYTKKFFLDKANDSKIEPSVVQIVSPLLDEKFDYKTIKYIVDNCKSNTTDFKLKKEIDKLLSLADSYHEIIFSLDTDISDRIIYPISDFESKGIEDARFVKFIKDDNTFIYYATYTAFDGEHIMPKLLETCNFIDFKVRPIYGEGAKNKNFALFPRKINGKFVMLSRIDGCSNFIMYSDSVNVWENPIKFQSPEFPWEFVQIGNCGSPIETEAGWLVITHGVGPMRKYCLSVTLLKLDDPSIVIGRLKEPILIANKDEREGYVPNVVYSCGSIINNGELIIPYGLSDYSSSFATVNLVALLAKLLEK